MLVNVNRSMALVVCIALPVFWSANLNASSDSELDSMEEGLFGTPFSAEHYPSEEIIFEPQPFNVHVLELPTFVQMAANVILSPNGPPRENFAGARQVLSTYPTSSVFWESAQRIMLHQHYLLAELRGLGLENNPWRPDWLAEEMTVAAQHTTVSNELFQRARNQRANHYVTVQALGWRTVEAQRRAHLAFLAAERELPFAYQRRSNDNQMQRYIAVRPNSSVMDLRSAFFDREVAMAMNGIIRDPYHPIHAFRHTTSSEYQDALIFGSVLASIGSLFTLLFRQLSVFSPSRLAWSGIAASGFFAPFMLVIGIKYIRIIVQHRNLPTEAQLRAEMERRYPLSAFTMEGRYNRFHRATENRFR